ncbi:hypothetical protein OHA72_15540 [Dactylosporangium sp. NBC_01737]|uniref:hypothetical protein n=1 Tax=Dactylosporangium sp. NBC_01737 TaxID=2975959 RepID=UPI002E15ADC6|nr:hypothetical protein OHA72_15540 [Dactylosporangium sp. NBC_01737]
MTAPVWHPGWCDRRHAADWPVHGAQIGADLELSHDLAYAVLLQQVDGSPAEVNLMRHTTDETSLTRFSIVEAAILRDLLGEGLGLLALEVGRCPIHPGQSATDCGPCRAERPGGTQ